jgi:kynurenine formamidase
MAENDHDAEEADGFTIGRRRFVGGVGTLAALAAAGVGTAGAQDDGEPDLTPVGRLLEDLPDNWGRWGEDDELGAVNELDSEAMFRGMQAVRRGGAENIERFTLQTPMTGEAIDALVDPEVNFPTTDTGDPAFPGRFPARKNNTADWDDAATNAGMRFADDRFATPLYLQGTSHMDALGHGWFADRDVAEDGDADLPEGVDTEGDINAYDEQVYNGFLASEVTTATEGYDIGVAGLSPDNQAQSVSEVSLLSKADISNAASAGVQGRGVLLDVGRYKDNSDEQGRLPLGDPVTLQDLQDTADTQGVEVEENDILLIRTGAIELARDPDAEWNALNEPGLTYSDRLVDWLIEKDIPYVAGDNLPVEKVTQDVSPDDLKEGRKELAGTYILPLHGQLLRNLGVTINEVLDLSELAAACAEDGIYDFLFTAAPLHVVGGTGAPVNPVVTKATRPGNASGGDGDGGRDGDEGRGPPDGRGARGNGR